MPPADPAPAPEWAVKDAHEFNAASGMTNEYYPDVYEHDLARLLATLRERTLREAALIALAEMRMDIRNAILSLIAQPPKPERSDGSEAEGREEA